LRAVSLIASATEIVCALGLKKTLVGRSHECDFPEDIKSLPVCTRPRVDVSGSSAQIDAAVKDALKNALSIYEVDSKLLSSLKPDVAITQVQCEVCAVSLKDVEQAMRREVFTRCQVVPLNPNCLDDIWSDVLRVAQALGADAKGKTLVASLKKRMKAVSAKAGKAKPSVALIEWTEPLMASGNWMPELVELAGGRNLFGKAGEHSPWMTFEELKKADPDVIVISPCGFDLARTAKEAAPLLKSPAWKKLRAVKEARVYLADGNQYFNRPGPRVVESLEILAEILHPGLSFGHEGRGWQKAEKAGA
jgi:iron complex transport system substrate-binding protein